MRIEHQASGETAAIGLRPDGNGTDGKERRAQTARFALREATGAAHAATEAAFAGYDLTDSADYTAFLQAHCAALHAIEPGLERGGWPQWVSRAQLLHADLSALTSNDALWHEPCRARQTPRPPLFGNDAECWGAQYVLEGSRLGGQLLSRRVGAGLPRAYLAPGPEDGERWRDFCSALDRSAATGADSAWLDSAVAAAIRTFRIFAIAAQDYRPTR